MIACAVCVKENVPLERLHHFVFCICPFTVLNSANAAFVFFFFFS